MKVGFRVPSLSKSLKARTTGKIKRVLKKNAEVLLRNLKLFYNK